MEVKIISNGTLIMLQGILNSAISKQDSYKEKNILYTDDSIELATWTAVKNTLEFVLKYIEEDNK